MQLIMYLYLKSVNCVSFALFPVQLEAALTMDAVDVLVEGLGTKMADDKNAWRSTFRRGQIYNNGTLGINCRAVPPIPWQHGPDIMKHLKQVSTF